MSTCVPRSSNRSPPQIEGNAENSLEVLSALDAVKSSMEKCSSILIEAEKLKKLSEDVDNVFRTNDFNRVSALSTKLGGAEREGFFSLSLPHLTPIPCHSCADIGSHIWNEAEHGDIERDSSVSRHSAPAHAIPGQA